MAKQTRKTSTPKETLAARVLEAGLDEPVQDIPRLEICAVRDLTSQGKGAITPDLLTELASNHDAETSEAPVTLDHAQEGPAYGWIGKAWVEAERLFCSLKSVPVSLVNAIKNERYRSRSIEFHRNWNGTGKAKLTAVSFLGAALPAIEGLKPVSLARGESHESADFDSAGASFADRFADAPAAEKLSASPPPAGAAMAGIVIVRDDRTGEVMGHNHTAYLDADGNGYTDKPGEWSSEHGGYEIEEEGHQHVVNGWLVEPAADENGVTHTHPLYRPSMLSAKDNTMPTPEVTPAPAAPAVNPDVEKLKADAEAMRVQLAASNAQIETLRAEAFARDQEAAFDKVFSAAQASGRAVPADRPVKLALFNALPPDADKTITLSAADGKTSEIGPRALFLQDLANGPVKVTLSRVTDPANVGGGDSAAPGDRDKKVVAEAEKLCAATPGLDYGTALVRADKLIPAA